MDLRNFREEGNLLIGVSGAVFSSLLPSYLSYITDNVCQNVKVILTDSTQRFINNNVVNYLTGSAPYSSFDQNQDFPAPHISLTKWADLFIILPASGNLISKAANGIADDLLSTSILAASCPVIFCPSMNITMWEKDAIQRNVSTLKKDGYHFQYKIDTVFTISSQEKEKQVLPDLDRLNQCIFGVLNRPA
jgi:phosphopantothenoylcysteine synthetase/decarboxylase